jgi:hypothetical protein
LVDGILMHKNAKEEVLMKCITQEAGIKLLEEIQSGTCSNHATSRTLVGKNFLSRILLVVRHGRCREASTPL